MLTYFILISRNILDLLFAIYIPCYVILNHADAFSGIIPPSPEEYPILGLNLLRLLVQNRIAEFHTELELLPAKALENICIKHGVELEQSFMEGAYNRVLSARQAVPHETYIYFMDLLAKTVRLVGFCCYHSVFDLSIYG
jgi:26S proteasome regulatory subunit N12